MPFATTHLQLFAHTTRPPLQQQATTSTFQRSSSPVATNRSILCTYVPNTSPLA